MLRTIGYGFLFSLSASLAILSTGCNRSGGERQYISVGTAPVGGTFYTVGGAVCEVVNNNSGDADWRVNAESTGGSMENIRLLSRGRLQFAMSNSSITYFAVRGEGDWDQTHEARAVMTLFPNIAMFVTAADSGIETVADLKGKRVYIGPEGAGFEYFVEPILAAHGLALSDLEVRYGSQQNAVDLLGDGAVSAAMIGGGVPTPAIAQLAQAMDLRLIPYDEAAKEQLIREYQFFEPAVIPGGTYMGIEEDYHGLNVGSAHLIAHADVDEQLVYDFVRIAYENREQIAERHRAAKAITPENASRNTGTPFHPGAIRYFKEAGIWSEEADAEAAPAASEGASSEGASSEGASSDAPESAPAEAVAAPAGE
ncbi:TAXI family TRAP transporter solute-binding subunit [Candidatus Laterigemmans baculatus]|uniref:TAXI family TRAP transporter solute-binding subunit n=1 Tax=Candidatus Laterigemmans baculatus TaxID=2770505 RepID=UPI0013DCD6C9|nr:TAXI family TRAP transporter solute-binding subunit [Candidatus Laterigemmans baculatus]